MSRTVRVLIIIAVIVIAVPALLLRGQRSRNRDALAAYKASLRAKGEKLTAEELGYPRPPEAASNLDLLLSGVNQITSGKFEPGSLELMRFVGVGRAEIVCTLPDLNLNYSPAAKTNRASWTEFSAQFDTNADAL